MIIDGIYVLPIPLNAPEVIISMHINNWEYPSIFRYFAPSFIVSDSFINIVKILLPPKINITVVINPNKLAIIKVILNPLFILSYLLAP